jgi:hypothetical protein
MKDRGGNWFDEASFNPEEPVFAEGGLANILQVPRKRFVEGGTDWSTVEANAPTENIVQDTGDGSSYEDRYNQMVQSHGGTPDRPPTNQGDGGNNLRPTITYTNTGQIDRLGLNTNIRNLVASGRISLEDALAGNFRPDIDFNYAGNNFNIAGQKRGDVKNLQANTSIGPVNVQGSYQDVDGKTYKDFSLGVNQGNWSGNLNYNPKRGTNVDIGYNTGNTNYGISHGPDGTQLKFGVKYKYNKGGLADILQVRSGYSKGRLVKGALAILNRNKKNAEYMFKASDNVSPGYAHGDLKYNAELLADQLAEDAGVVFADLDSISQTKFYGTAYDYLAAEMGKHLLQKRMLKDVGQKMILSDFNVKGRKPNASGGLAKILEV